MVSAITNLWISFLAGLFAPLGAVCVLPLYPGFLAYLSSKLSGKESKNTIMMFGVIVTLGVITSMLIFGLIFTKLLQVSLTRAIGIISPIAFGILTLVSLLLIFNIDFGRFFPKTHAPVLKNPYLSSFIFGLFFGAIVLPCNPASLIVLFAVSTSTISFVTNFLNFVLFGIGMALPLLIFAIISATKSQQVIGFLTSHKRIINLVAGIIMFIISLYYLIFVFKVFGG
jgi:cytochrome c-type biogenesis protein